jgi:hypothetical protein
MKILVTKNYLNKESAYEGQVLTPDMEDEFVSNVEDENQRRKRTNFYTKSPNRGKSPSRETYMGLRGLGEERGYVEDPLNFQDVVRKRTRIQKALERDRRLDSDRYEHYRDLPPEVVDKTLEDVDRYEMENPGVIVPDRMIRLLLEKKRTTPAPPKFRKLRQLNRMDERVAYTIDDDAAIELSEREETNTVLDFLCFLNDEIENFAKSKEIDPDSLREYLFGGQ